MDCECYEVGAPIDPRGMRIRLAIGFVQAVRKHRYARLRRVLKCDDAEGVEFDLDTELPQRPAADIRGVERILVCFDPNPNKPPQALPLRRGFPTELLHLNLTARGEPRSLCLFSEDYRDVAGFVTPELLLRRVASWLRRAALDELHLPGQLLEPFLLCTTQVIFDPLVFNGVPDGHVLMLVGLSDKPYPVLRVQPVPLDRQADTSARFVVLPLSADPWHARMIHTTPGSVADIHCLLYPLGIDLTEKLRAATIALMDAPAHDTLMQCNWMILLELPKSRVQRGAVETYEYWAFFVLEAIGGLRTKLDLCEKRNGCWGRVLQRKAARDLDKVAVEAVRPIPALTRQAANLLAGVKRQKTLDIAAVGAGAIGSHIVMNLARQGIGKWVIIDEDQLLPHNNTRHALSPQLSQSHS